MLFRIFLFIIIFAFSIFGNILWIYAENTKTEAERKTEECMEARKNRQEASITEYICPSGEYFYESGLPISRDRICGSIYIQIEFAKIDAEALKWAEALQNMRNTNIESWIDTIKKESISLEKKYMEICTIEKYRKECKPKSTDAFPDTICNDLAKQKGRAWENMGYILAGQGIAKAYQNDKDVFIDKTKGKYAKITEKWNRYLRTFHIAVSKFTAYIRNAVK